MYQMKTFKVPPIFFCHEIEKVNSKFQFLKLLVFMPNFNFIKLNFKKIEFPLPLPEICPIRSDRKMTHRKGCDAYLNDLHRAYLTTAAL